MRNTIFFCRPSSSTSRSAALHLNHLVRRNLGGHLAVAVHLGAKVYVLIASAGAAWKCLPRRPDFCISAGLLLVVLLNGFADLPLEEERSLLHGRVHLTVDEDTGAEIFLGVDAQILVLRHDALVHVIDECKVLILGILVSEDFILHH